MLSTDQIAEPCHSSCRAIEISELPFAIQRGGVPNDVIVNMGFVDMSANDESVFSFEKTRSEVIANLISFLRCNFAGFEGLANLVSDNIVLFLFAGEVAVLPFCQSKLGIKASVIAGIGRNQFTVIRLVGIYSIVSSVRNTLRQGFAFVDVHGNYASGWLVRSVRCSLAAGYYPP